MYAAVYFDNVYAAVYFDNVYAAVYFADRYYISMQLKVQAGNRNGDH